MTTVAFGQLQWSSYTTGGNLVTTNAASGGDATYGGNVTLTFPASTETVYITRTFAPVGLPAASTSVKVNFNMTASGGLLPGVSGRILGFGLLNDPGTASTLDDTGYWTDFNTGNPSFELFYRLSTVATFFQFDTTHKLGSSTTQTGLPTNGTTYGMQFQLNMNSSATSISIGTSKSTFAGVGAGMTNLAGTVNELSFSSALALTTLATTNFNEFAFMLNNTTASPVTVTLSGITLVPANPVIATQPSPYSGSPGDNTTFTVALNGSSGAPLSYKWYEVIAGATNALVDGTNPDGSIVSGSTNSVLHFNNAQVADTGNLFVVVTNPYGTVTSAQALLNIASSSSAPVINSIAPLIATVVAGNGTNIAIVAVGSPSPFYYWFDNNGSLLQASSSPGLTLANLQLANAGSYSVIASNTVGTATTNFTVNVIVTPAISSQPTNLLLNAGQPASFSVTASGLPAPTYQWYQNNVLLAGATSSNYAIASVAFTNIGVYTVIVSNAAGAVMSSGATLAIYSTMNGTPVSPANNATGVCVDTLLTLTFDQTPSAGSTGQVRIYDAANPGTPVDTIDLTSGNLQGRTIGGVSLNSYGVITQGNAATIYPHAKALTTNKTYFVQIDPGVILDPNGAYYTGVSSSNAWQFTTKPGGPGNPTNLVVAASGTGDFATVQGAIDFIPASNSIPTVINIQNGVYTEINRVNAKNKITLIGQSRHQTILTYANNNNINGSTTTRPMFAVVSATDVALENLTLTNSTPHGGSQAEALLINLSKRIIVLDADLDSFQDTLLVNQSGDLAYVQDSHIQGDTDYVWGSGTLYTTNCELMAMTTQSHLTQARTAQFTNGLAFVNCRIFGANAGITNSDLGRDAGATGSVASFPYGQVAYINCAMDTNLIVPGGWTLGSGTSQGPATSNLRFWEYQSVDLNNNPVPTNGRVAWSLELDPGTATNQVQNVTNWLYGWQPQLAPNILTQPTSQSVGGGQLFTLGVVGAGIPAPNYQWLKNGNPIPSATNATFAVSDAYAGDAAGYSVIVSNSAGAVVSSVATVTVSNTAPTLNAFTNQTINAGVNLTVNSVATDPDQPTQTLTFSLGTAPANASINTGSGAISWRPAAAQGGTTNLFSVIVTDNGSPNLSASQNFSVVVNPVVSASLGSATFTNGQFSLTVSGGTQGPDYLLQVSTNLNVWQTIATNASPTLPFTFLDTNAAATQQFYRIRLSP